MTSPSEEIYQEIERQINAYCLHFALMLESYRLSEIGLEDIASDFAEWRVEMTKLETDYTEAARVEETESNQ